MINRFKALFLLGLLFSTATAATAATKSVTTSKAPADAVLPGQATSAANSAVRQGIKIQLSVEPTGTQDGVPAIVREGEYALVKLKMNDATTGAPVTAMTPRAWLDLRKDYKGMTKGVPMTCTDKVKSFLQGTLAFKPDLDLNSYFILTLNNDATISVIDPIRGVTGFTQLYAMVILPRPGENWVFGRDQQLLYVTMPKADQVAVVDTESFKVERTLPGGGNPKAIVIQPDGKYLWVGNDATDSAKSGVTVFDTSTEKAAAFIQTGSGHHEIAFADDSRYAYVTNKSAGTVSVIDVQTLKKVKDLATGAEPTGVAFSSLSKALYVADPKEGTVTVIDGTTLQISGQIVLGQGTKIVKLAPGDRWAFVANQRTNQVQVIDVSTNAVAYTEEAGVEPEHITFTKEFAYVRSRGTAEVTLLPLASLGKSGSLSPLKISGGQKAPGEALIQPTTAEVIVSTPEGNAVMIASPADATLVYYMEGMGVPMGSLKTYGSIPRAVTVLNRQLKETAPGIYSTKVRIPKSGVYDTALVLDSPRIVQCFEFSAAANPVMVKHLFENPLAIEFLAKEKKLTSGGLSTLRFKLTSTENGEPMADLKDFIVMGTHMPNGDWQERFTAKSVGNGLYEVEFRLPKPGVYNFYFASPSLKVKFSQLPYLPLHVEK